MRPIDADALFPNGVFIVNGDDPMTSLDELLNRIHAAPTLDLEPVRYGRWDSEGRCDQCGGFAPRLATIEDWYASPFCFECGAHMENGDKKRHTIKKAGRA